MLNDAQNLEQAARENTQAILDALAGHPCEEAYRRALQTALKTQSQYDTELMGIANRTLGARSGAMRTTLEDMKRLGGCP